MPPPTIRTGTFVSFDMMGVCDIKVTEEEDAVSLTDFCHAAERNGVSHLDRNSESNLSQIPYSRAKCPRVSVRVCQRGEYLTNCDSRALLN